LFVRKKRKSLSKGKREKGGNKKPVIGGGKGQKKIVGGRGLSVTGEEQFTGKRRKRKGQRVSGDGGDGNKMSVRRGGHPFLTREKKAGR